MTPTISIQLDLDSCQYELMCESYSRIAPAGPRIFRAPPHPDVKFRHDTLSAAQTDAQKIRDYLSNLGTRKQSKQAIREFAATHA